jgi:Hemerythrin HHE cation binding domain
VVGDDGRVSTAEPIPQADLGVAPTEPPRGRLAERTVLDEATRPQAPPPPPGVYTAYQRSSAQHLIDVHDHLRAELEEVRSVTELVLRSAMDVGEARAHLHLLTVRQQNWSLGAYCQSYCRLVTGHHSLEDAAMLPHLRRAQPDLGPVLDRLEQEHQAIHGVLEELDRALVRFVDEPGDGSRLREAVGLLTDTLLSHLAYEERQLVAPLARHGLA